MVVRQHPDVILDLLAPAGKRILDVGCGEGWLVRALAKVGASVTGIEPGPVPLAVARRAPKVSDEQYVEGSGEALPFPDASFDAVVYMNALHHVPIAAQAQAIREAARVLMPRGNLLIIEPIAEGPHFELIRTFDDETAVRESALRAIRATPGELMRLAHETYYDAPALYADFAAFKARMTTIDPHRATALARLEPQLARDFAAKGRAVAGGMEFSQPARLDMFIRAAP
jgi:ubiquinone/menaquinone biosynthesis C-methylase UbiE